MNTLQRDRLSELFEKETSLKDIIDCVGPNESLSIKIAHEKGVEITVERTSRADTPTVPPGLGPVDLLRAGIKAVPAVKYALGIGGIVAVLAIVRSFGLGFKVAALGTVVMLVLMSILLVFARAAGQKSSHFQVPALVFTWFCLMLFMAVALSFFTSVFWGKPLDLRNLLESQKVSNVTSQGDTPTTTLAPASKSATVPTINPSLNTGAPDGTDASVPQRATKLASKKNDSGQKSATSRIGDNNTLVGTPVPSNVGSGNTLVGPTDSNGNTILNLGGTAIGSGACADSTSVAIGAKALAGSCTTSQATAFVSDLTVTEVKAIPFEAGKPMGANIAYINEGRTTLSMLAYGGMSVRVRASIEKEEDRRNLEESEWDAFIAGIEKEPIPPRMPVPPHIVLHIAVPPRSVGYSTLENTIVYFFGVLRYENSSGIHEVDVCWFGRNSLDPLFVCRGHNGPVAPSF